MTDRLYQKLPKSTSKAETLRLISTSLRPKESETSTIIIDSEIFDGKNSQKHHTNDKHIPNADEYPEISQTL